MGYPIKLLDKQRQVAIYHLVDFITKHVILYAKPNLRSHRLVFRLPEMDEQPAPMVIVVLGPPGAGKGTQSSMLANLLRVPRISIGSLLRWYARDESEVGVHLRGMMALGSLVTDTLVVDVLAARIGELDCARGLILDGFPRTLRQAELLECGPSRSSFHANNLRENLVALHLRVQKNTIVGRLSGRRLCSRCSATYHLESQPPRVSGEC